MKSTSPIPEIAGLPGATDRPLWSVMIPAFNAGADLRKSLGSVLANGFGPEVMQIEVVDDRSTRDDPERIVEELGNCRVGFYRQPCNVGHSRNFNTCLARSRGQLVHILHADDWVAEGFYARLASLFDEHPTIGAAFCRHAVIGADDQVVRFSPLEREKPGILEGWLESIAAELRLQPPSIVVRRAVYERLGGFDTRLESCGEDWEMWVRIAAHYPVAFEPEILAFYRDNAESLTKRSIRSGQNIRDVRKATQLTRSYLKDKAALDANRRARDNWARWAVHWAHEMIERNDFRAATVQLWQALMCSRSANTIGAVGRVGRYGLRRAAARIFSRASRRG